MMNLEPEEGIELAIGTGFIYEFEGYYYIITNGHCITGVNPEGGQRLSKHAAFPTHLFLHLRTRVSKSEATSADKAENKDAVWAELGRMHPENVRVELYSDDDYTKPKWYVHPDYGHQVDVVAIPLIEKEKVPDHLMLWALNNNRSLEAEPEVADDVYILGYPFGITDSLEFPVWKKGSIATEPSVFYKGLPRMLVDTATRSGMSGSPVILMRSGVHNMENGQLTTKSLIGTVFGFVGVYSGRIGAEKENEAQLGIVWRKEVIEEIIIAKRLATTEFHNAQL
ncbi:serine protease [Hymenobacter sp. UV11]|uniref:S1 family peptidase n=1 Tax=Hymenobacter sp. UV11 TaxID=1849735 RepID=UPI00141525EA|nr:serine protease [Hymenobacter sp. UV11]